MFVYYFSFISHPAIKEISIIIKKGVSLQVLSDFSVSKNLLIQGGSSVVIGGNMSLSERTKTTINPEKTQIQVRGCANFGGELHLEDKPKIDRQPIINFNCSSGEFSSVTVGNCQISKDEVTYAKQSVYLTLSFDFDLDTCTSPNSESFVLICCWILMVLLVLQ